MMEDESLCDIEIVKENNEIVAKIRSNYGGHRSYRSDSFEEILEQLVQDLQEEFDDL